MGGVVGEGEEEGAGGAGVVVRVRREQSESKERAKGNFDRDLYRHFSKIRNQTVRRDIDTKCLVIKSVIITRFAVPDHIPPAPYHLIQ